MADIVQTETVIDLVADTAIQLIEAGFSPVAAIKKAMKYSGWQNLDLAIDEVASHFKLGDNIAIRMGITAGGNYATIDIDCDEAHNFRRYLPKTKMMHGREGNKYSHATYRILGDDPLATKPEALN